MQGQPRRDREWDNWPGRGSADDGIRHRLKALFASTENEEEAIEALIAQRGREIEEQTDQLQATIADLERREEQTGRLRSAVEEMLRHGSAELDERHADLATLARELGEREERVRADERDIAVRKQELGAVELRRAAVERREEGLAAREEALDRVAGELTRREAELAVAEDVVGQAGIEGFGAPADEPEATVHMLYLPGYSLEEHPGPAPEPGSVIVVAGRRLVVARVGRAPLPGDRRPCAYLEPGAGPPEAAPAF